MITDKKQNKIFSILKNTQDSLILQTNGSKYICKTYLIPQQILSFIQNRTQLQHANLIQLNHIEFNQSNPLQQKISVGLIHEYYCKTLEDCFFEYGAEWDDSEIINTFEPILQVVNYLNKRNYWITNFSLKNIVITEDESIKLIDTFFHQEEIKLTLNTNSNDNNFNQLLIYEQIAQTIYNMLFPTLNCKSWKNKMKVIKQNSSRDMYHFISSIHSKSMMAKTQNLTKTKQIRKKRQTKDKKQNIQDVINKLPKSMESKGQKELSSSTSSTFHCGKQNKIIQ